MYVQGEYNNDWERVGGEESVSGIFQIFQIFAIFELPQNVWDKNFQNKCKEGHALHIIKKGTRLLHAEPNVLTVDSLLTGTTAYTSASSSNLIPFSSLW